MADFFDFGFTAVDEEELQTVQAVTSAARAVEQEAKDAPHEDHPPEDPVRRHRHPTKDEGDDAEPGQQGRDGTDDQDPLTYTLEPHRGPPASTHAFAGSLTVMMIWSTYTASLCPSREWLYRQESIEPLSWVLIIGHP